MPVDQSILLTTIHQHDPNLEDSSEDYGNNDDFDERISLPERIANDEQNEIICIGFKKKIDTNKHEKVIENGEIRRSPWNNLETSQFNYQSSTNQNRRNVDFKKERQHGFIINKSIETENEIADLKVKIDSLYAKLTEIETKHIHGDKIEYECIDVGSQKLINNNKMKRSVCTIQPSAFTETSNHLVPTKRFKNAATITPFVNEDMIQNSMMVPDQHGLYKGNCLNGHRIMIGSKIEENFPSIYSKACEWNYDANHNTQPVRINASCLSSNPSLQDTSTKSRLNDVTLKLRLAQHARRRLNNQQKDVCLTENNNQKRRKLSSSEHSETNPYDNFPIHHDTVLKTGRSKMITHCQQNAGYLQSNLWTEQQIKPQNFGPTMNSVNYFPRACLSTFPKNQLQNIYRHIPQSHLPSNNHITYQNTVPLLPSSCNLSQQNSFNCPNQLPKNASQIINELPMNTLTHSRFDNKHEKDSSDYYTTQMSNRVIKKHIKPKNQNGDVRKATHDEPTSNFTRNPASSVICETNVRRVEQKKNGVEKAKSDRTTEPFKRLRRTCNEWSVVTLPLPTILHIKCHCFSNFYQTFDA